MDVTWIQRTKSQNIHCPSLCVKTNVDFQVVGAFVIQDETTALITEPFESLHK